MPCSMLWKDGFIEAWSDQSYIYSETKYYALMENKSRMLSGTSAPQDGEGVGSNLLYRRRFGNSSDMVNSVLLSFL